jgi:metal-sulfur cluster biosynthetic enzyme
VGGARAAARHDDTHFLTVLVHGLLVRCHPFFLFSYMAPSKDSARAFMTASPGSTGAAFGCSQPWQHRPRPESTPPGNALWNGLPVVENPQAQCPGETPRQGGLAAHTAAWRILERVKGSMDAFARGSARLTRYFKGDPNMTIAVTEAMVLDALRKVIDPELHHDVVELGFIQEVEILGDYVHLDVQLTTPHCPFAESIVNQMKDAVAGVPGVKKVEVERACMKED